MDINLGKRLIDQKKYKKALSFFLSEIEKGNKSIGIYFFLGLVYFKLNQIENSINYYKKALKINDKSIRVILNLANAYYTIGNFLDAKNLYLDAIKINQYDPRPYYGLYLLDQNNLSNENISLLNKLKNRGAPLNESYLIEYLLSKIAKKNNQYKSELEHLNNFQNQCFKLKIDFNLQGLFYYNKIISRHYNKINFLNYKTEDNDFNHIKPIFIIGLPRSGSTLIESCISSANHKIVSLGETSIINSAIIEQIKNIIFEKRFQTENYTLGLDVEKLKNYILNVYQNFFPSNCKNLFFIDKSLENFFNIEVILTIFPKARFIYSARNYKDTAIAIYQSMLPDLPWTHSIPHILDYIDNHIKIMNFFKKKYPDKILSIELENLTEKKEYITKKIFTFCGLKWSPEVLQFHQKKNLIIKTLSGTQLRKEISKYDLKKYKPYENILSKYKDEYTWLN